MTAQEIVDSLVGRKIVRIGGTPDKLSTVYDDGSMDGGDFWLVLDDGRTIRPVAYHGMNSGLAIETEETVA